MKIQFSGENLFCNLINTKDDEFICTICENRYIVPDFDIDLPKLLCKKLIAKNNPSIKKIKTKIFIGKRILNFIVALIKHLLNGGKRTSKEERDRRYSICQGCEFFDKSSCTQCGCPISRHEKFISKLDWANQHCPVGKW
jgi:hypothetical protein